MQRIHDLTTDDLNVLVDTIDDGITIQAPDGALLFANTRAALILGHASASELLASPLTDVMARFDLLDERGTPMPSSELPSRNALRGVTGEAHVRFRMRATGAEHWSILKSTPRYHADGTLKFVINVFRDITTQKVAENALRESNEWFSTTLKSIGDAVLTTDHDGRVTYLNAVAEALTGWSAGDAAGRSISEVFRILNETTRLDVESPVTHVLRDGVVVGLANHTLLVRKDGTEIAIDDSGAPIRDTNGKMVGVVLVFRDISEKHREEQRQHFIDSAIAELSSSLDYEVTLQAVARLAVPEVADWCAVDMLVDGELRRLAVAHVDPAKIAFAHEMAKRYPTAPDATRGVPQVLRTGKTEWLREIPDEMLVAGTVDEEHLRLARDIGFKSYIVAPMIAHGVTLGALTFVAAGGERRFDEKDVRVAETVAERAAVALDNARLFREATLARASAEAATELREQLLGIVSHDLRNPLSAVLMSGVVLRQQHPDEPGVAKLAQRVINSAERMGKLISQLLDFSRAYMGTGFPVERAEAQLDVICRDVIDELQTAHPGCHIPFECGELVTGHWDGDRLGAAVSNLVANGVQHGDGKTVRVGLRQKGDEAVIEVQNGGEPIAADLIPHIFEPFRGQRDPRRFNGLGLGLYIAREIVRAHDGTLDVASSHEAGTTFTVRLPLRRSA